MIMTMNMVNEEKAESMSVKRSHEVDSRDRVVYEQECIKSRPFKQKR